MNIVDIVILVILLASIIQGWRRGAITSVVNLVGSIIVFIIAFYLKTPLSIYMYEHLPFFSFKGIFENITVMNILVYETLSFLITASILFIILKIILKVTGLIDKILSKLILLGLPSKIIGAIVGFAKGYILVFVLLFLSASFPKLATYTTESRMNEIIINRTPVLSDVIGDTMKSANEIREVCINSTNKEQANLESLDILMKYEILSYESANKLLETNKLKITNAETVVEKYRGE